MASHQLPPLTTVDSSFMPDQSNDEYVMRKEEKTAVEHCEQVPEDDIPRKRKPLKHYLCCICCPCLPMWARYGCCSLLVLFVLFLIIVGVLAALFKIPEVNFNGPTKHPAGYAPFEKSNDTLAFSVNFGLQIGVVNDNVESITFESIRAIAYYPTAPKVSVGGGEILNVHIQSYGITNFTFPFSIKYDPMKDEGYAMLTDIASKCGLLGGSNKEDLYIEYDLIPTIRIAGIAISPTIHQSSHFPCPISSGQLTMGLTASFNEDGDDEGDEDEED
ncbi:hypothetical protein V8B55DRAFT_1571592 [Mucor lusitanicus]|uniref:Late embryogenesis abundant protein LEA-2 subgroup domain-containing protein n=1 Tax=Mucor circinelloides f. lusitanicus TaxID=29924 RepID=A0A8H4BHT1_MUCCL|nr:hypothetical protein FB192DRAFT_1435690 [Mucor lusitanicus]